MKTAHRLVAFILSAGLAGTAQGANLTIPHTFTSGTPAVAAQVNANFTAVETVVDDHDARIAALEARVAALEAKLASVTVETANGHPTVRFSGVNVQVVNGLGRTETANGTGNLIVGYDEADTSGRALCTVGYDAHMQLPALDPTTCTSAGGSWSTTGFKIGSHYLVVGHENNYSRWGGIVSGFHNTASYDDATVIGGAANIACGLRSSVNGGVSNIASGQFSLVSGGHSNSAGGLHSSVSGGYYNTAGGSRSSVSGGDHNTASGTDSSVSGGSFNTASGENSSVSGGYNRSASDTNNWAAGTYSSPQ